MIIYLVVNLVNGKRYVGQTRIGLEKRWRQHLRDATNGSLLPLHRAIRKHGQKEFITIPLELYLDYDRLNSREQELIASMKTRVNQHGYNITAGGFGGHRDAPGPMTDKKHSIETKEKMHNSHVGKPHPQKFRDQYGSKNAMFGKPAWNRGQPMLQDLKDRISAIRSVQGSPVTPNRLAAHHSKENLERLARNNDAKRIYIEGKSLKQLVEETGIKYVTLWWRYKKGWPVEAILERKAL